VHYLFILSLRKIFLNIFQSTWKVLSTKVEIKLKKKDGHHWTKLEGDGSDPILSASRKDSTFKTSKGRDWDKIGKEIEKVSYSLHKNTA
jgi:hypothetical protein